MKSIVFHLLLILSAFCGISSTTTTSLQSSTRSVSSKVTCDPNQCAKNWHLCDGVEDCEDGCDENAELCKLARGCTLPDTTNEDKSYAVNCDENATPNAGDYVPEMSMLSFVCKPGYKLHNGDEHFQSLCLNGNWTPDISPCIKKCPKLNVPNIEYECYYNGEKIECSDEPVIGTKLRISCSLPHHRPNQADILCNQHGEWDVQDIACVPECGQYSNEAALLYQNNYLPWNVVIHSQIFLVRIIISDGTLIAPDLVLTGAKHLKNQDNETTPAKRVQVTVNGYLDQAHQKSYKVKEIIFSPKGFFNKPNNLEDINDIVILKLESKVEISATVQPVCLDWTGVILPSKVSPSRGKMYTRQWNRVGIAHINAYDLETCTSKLKTEIVLGYDQFCGEYEDTTKTHTPSDQGTGYFVENPLDGRFYIKGILRTNNKAKELLLFTNVESHIDWIKPIFEKSYDTVKLYPEYSNLTIYPSLQHDSQISSKRTTGIPLYYGSWKFNCNAGELQVESTGACSIPPNDKANTSYKLQCPFIASNQPKIPCNNASEGALVPEHSVLNIQCKEGYVSTSENVEKSFCVGGQWVPKFPPDTSVQLCRKSQVESLECRYQGEVIDCGDELIVKYST